MAPDIWPAAMGEEAQAVVGGQGRTYGGGLRDDRSPFVSYSVAIWKMVANSAKFPWQRELWLTAGAVFPSNRARANYGSTSGAVCSAYKLETNSQKQLIIAPKTVLPIACLE